MVCKSKTMLDIEYEIRHQVKSRAELDQEFEDKNDPVLETNKDQMKKLIPKNVREAKIPLNHSKLIKMDRHYATTYSAITNVLEKAKLVHKT